MPTLLILDDPVSAHGRRMGAIARSYGVTPRFLVPGVDLPSALDAVRVSSISVPMGILGGNDLDLFTNAVRAALQGLRARGSRVFISAGNDAENALAVAGISCAPMNGRTAQLMVPRSSLGSSGACVALGAAHAILGGRGRLRRMKENRITRSRRAP